MQYFFYNNICQEMEGQRVIYLALISSLRKGQRSSGLQTATNLRGFCRWLPSHCLQHRTAQRRRLRPHAFHCHPGAVLIADSVWALHWHLGYHDPGYLLDIWAVRPAYLGPFSPARPIDCKGAAVITGLHNLHRPHKVV